MTATLQVPERLSSREQARALLRDLPPDLAEGEVEIDCAGVFVSTPSFMDELVRVILCERAAQRLRLLHAPERTATYVRRAAQNRSVADRLVIGG